ncbi:MAG: hypothetical protein SF097_22055 [Acidobacteriota bacterium]|nr:hypothetical protein [Acidobacteriota bacterium]
MQPALVQIQNSKLSRQEKEQALDSVLRSGIVREHSNLYLLLDWLGRKSLDASVEPLKEYTIGVEALGKPSDYDPRLDPTVRVDIGKLRTKLKDFFQNGGSALPVHLEIPKGRYDVSFLRVEPVSTALAPAMVLDEIPAAKSQRKFHVLAAVALLVLAVIVVAAFRFTQPTAAETSALAPELQQFWQPYLASGKPTLLIFGTPMFVRLDRYFYREPRLNRWEDVETDEEVSLAAKALRTSEKRPSFKFTGVGEAESLFMLTRMLTEQRATLSVKRSNNLSWEDLKGRHVILLGSQKYNPQILKFPYQLKFEADRGRVTNLFPAAGEIVEYNNVFREKFGEAVETYAVISVFPGLDPQTRVTMLACSSNEGTGGAAEYVTRLDTMKELFQKMNLTPGQPLPEAFQAVIRVKLNEGVPVQLSYVTHHVLAR